MQVYNKAVVHCRSFLVKFLDLFRGVFFETPVKKGLSRRD